MLNLLYHGSTLPTLDEKIYARLSEHTKNRFDIFGILPDVIDDDWIEDDEKREARPRAYTEKPARQNPFVLRYAEHLDPNITVAYLF